MKDCADDNEKDTNRNKRLSIINQMERFYIPDQSFHHLRLEQQWQTRSPTVATTTTRGSKNHKWLRKTQRSSN